MAVNTLKSQKLLEVLIFTSQMFFIDKKEKQGQSDNAGGNNSTSNAGTGGDLKGMPLLWLYRDEIGDLKPKDGRLIRAVWDLDNCPIDPKKLDYCAPIIQKACIGDFANQAGFKPAPMSVQTYGAYPWWGLTRSQFDSTDQVVTRESNFTSILDGKICVTKDMLNGRDGHRYKGQDTDSKVEQSLADYARYAPEGSVLVLLSSDRDFVEQLSALRQTKGVITILVGKNASQQMRGVASKNMTWDAFLKDLGIAQHAGRPRDLTPPRGSQGGSPYGSQTPPPPPKSPQSQASGNGTGSGSRATSPYPPPPPPKSPPPKARKSGNGQISRGASVPLSDMDSCSDASGLLGPGNAFQVLKAEVMIDVNTFATGSSYVMGELAKLIPDPKMRPAPANLNRIVWYMVRCEHSCVEKRRALGIQLNDTPKQLGGKKRSMELLAAVVASLIIDKGIHCELLRKTASDLQADQGQAHSGLPWEAYRFLGKSLVHELAEHKKLVDLQLKSTRKVESDVELWVVTEVKDWSRVGNSFKRAYENFWSDVRIISGSMSDEGMIKTHKEAQKVAGRPENKGRILVTMSGPKAAKKRAYIVLLDVELESAIQGSPGPEAQGPKKDKGGGNQKQGASSSNKRSTVSLLLTKPEQFFLEGMRMGDLGHIIGFQANNQTYKRAKELLDKWTLEKQLMAKVGVEMAKGKNVHVDGQAQAKYNVTGPAGTVSDVLSKLLSVLKEVRRDVSAATRTIEIRHGLMPMFSLDEAGDLDYDTDDFLKSASSTYGVWTDLLSAEPGGAGNVGKEEGDSQKQVCVSVGDASLQVSLGDILKQATVVDAIVNPANRMLNPSGGLSLVIDAAAGDRLSAACTQILNGFEDRQIPLATAFDTEGFDIPCKIIHVAGPIWDAARAEECKSEIRQAVKSCLQLATAKGIKSLCLPFISAGIFGTPQEIAGPASIQAAWEYLTTTKNHCITSLTFITNSDYDLALAATQELQKLSRTTEDLTKLLSFECLIAPSPPADNWELLLTGNEPLPGGGPVVAAGFYPVDAIRSRDAEIAYQAWLGSGKLNTLQNFSFGADNWKHKDLAPYTWDFSTGQSPDDAGRIVFKGGQLNNKTKFQRDIRRTPKEHPDRTQEQKQYELDFKMYSDRMAKVKERQAERQRQEAQAAADNLNTTFPKRKLVLMGVNNKDGKTGGVIAIARVLEKKFPEDNASLHDRFDLQRDFPQTAGGPRLRDYPEAWAAVLHLTTHRGLHVEVTLSELDGRDILEVFGIHALRFRNCLRDTVINMFWPSFPWPAIPSGGSFLRRLDQESPEVQAVKYYFEQTNATKKKIELVAVDQICNEALYKSFVAHRLNRLGQYQPLFTGSAPLVRPEQMVQWLWHGTRGTDPAALYESLNGFNCGFSGDTLMFGHGNYFSTASSYSVFTGIAAKLAYNVDTQKLKRAPSFDSNANRNISAAMAGKTVPTILLPMYTSVPQRRHLPVVNPGWVESVQAGDVIERLRAVHNTAADQMDSVASAAESERMFIIYSAGTACAYPHYLVHFKNI